MVMQKIGIRIPDDIYTSLPLALIAYLINEFIAPF